MASIAGVFIKDSTVKRGRPIHAQAREIIYNVYQYFVKESFKFKKYMDADGNYYFKKVQERVCQATGISRKTISRILTEAETASNIVETPSSSIKFTTPKKGRKKLAFRVDLDNFDYDVIRRTVYDFQLKHRELPTLKSLNTKLSETIGYKGSVETIRRILRELGMRFVKIEKNKKVLMEQHDVRLKRIEYLEKIKTYRSESKNVVYIGETTIDLSHKKGEDGKIEVKKPKGGEHLVVAYAGNETGFVPGAFSVYVPSDMNNDYIHYEKWLRNQLMVNIPKNSILVIDDSPNNNRYVDRPPNANSIKEQMINWLKRQNIPVDTTLSKPQIYAIVCRHKDNLTEFAVDKLVAEYGHTILRLPSYHAKFNPLESIWLDFRSNVAAASTEYGNMNLTTAKKIITERVNMFSAEKWKKLCEEAIKSEDEYRKKEHALDEYLDRIMVNDCNFESDGDCYDSSDSEMEVVELED